MKFAIVLAIAAASFVAVNAAPAKPVIPESKLVEIKGLKPAKNFAVLKAVYGRNTQKSKDVTKIVQDLVAKKKDFRVTNTLFTDPCPGYGKKLEIAYTINGQVKIMTVGETQMVVIKNFK